MVPGFPRRRESRMLYPDLLRCYLSRIYVPEILWFRDKHVTFHMYAHGYVSTWSPDRRAEIQSKKHRLEEVKDEKN
jgi:hypothetical protein